MLKSVEHRSVQDRPPAAAPRPAGGVGPGTDATSTHLFNRRTREGCGAAVARPLAVETPVAIELNGIGYAVLMASPSDLVDLACGFLLTERIIEGMPDIVDIDLHEADRGIIVRLTLVSRALDTVGRRVRHRASDSSCGLCGIENLEQALRPLPPIEAPWTGSDAAVFAALAELDARQTLNGATGAVHAAARCDPDGRIVEVREDVGRHNAFDKLIGAMLRDGAGWEDGFALLTSRCSYELVEKAVLSGCPMLATISAPTSLAVARSAEAGLALRVLARRDALLATG